MSLPVLDFEKLLTPISGENPAGKYIRGDIVTYDNQQTTYYGAIDKARSIAIGVREKRATEDKEAPALSAKAAAWSGVIKLTVDALETKTKDLHVAAFLVDALVNRSGFAGLRDGLRLLKELQGRFWRHLYPGVEESSIDLEHRRGPLVWLNTNLPISLRQAPVVQSEDKGWSWWDWDRASNQANAEALKQFEQVKTATPRLECEELLTDIHQSLQEYEQLDQIVEEKFGELCHSETYLAQIIENEELDPDSETHRQKAVRLATTKIPQLSGIKETIEQCQALVEQIVEEKRQKDPTYQKESEQKPEISRPIKEELPKTLDKAISQKSGEHIEPQSRADALLRLDAVAKYFRRTEPHSPIPYLIERAIRWGGMNLGQWMQDVMGDEESVPTQLRETLGLNKKRQESE